MCCFVPQMREPTKEPSQTTKDAAGDADAQVKGEDADAINVWKAGMLISLRDDDGDAFAHGSVIDGEPSPDIFDDNALVSAEHVEPGWWVHVKITSVVDPRIKLLPDCVFSHDGQELPNNDRTPKALQELEDGIVIWHEYVVARKMGKKKPRRSSSSPAEKVKYRHSMPSKGRRGR